MKQEDFFMEILSLIFLNNISYELIKFLLSFGCNILKEILTMQLLQKSVLI